ncbi:MAG: DNA-deoxyinosine glycosylase [Gammaproteobacteria bacterium]|nr:MAG: DNA-deoxyinosine glycosylase [Gammaproteobacteria bacterium]
MPARLERLPLDKGFAPVVDHRARLLILGSMPGQASLQAAEYYAHPRNAFWTIMAQLFGWETDLSYPERLEKLKGHGIALWDVIKQCQRPGSLDQHIVEDSIVPNDFDRLFRLAPQVQAVFCNGQRAYSLYTKWVRPTLDPPFAKLPVTRLPSTSPAHASLNLADKLQYWQTAIQPFMKPTSHDPL